MRLFILDVSVCSVCGNGLSDVAVEWRLYNLRDWIGCSFPENIIKQSLNNNACPQNVMDLLLHEKDTLQFEILQSLWLIAQHISLFLEEINY